MNAVTITFLRVLPDLTGVDLTKLLAKLSGATQSNPKEPKAVAADAKE